MCCRKDHSSLQKKVSLYDSYNRGIIKYGFSKNSRSHKKTTCP